jgi:peptidoglycan L-alanyl-D-glutamate endopeptidase CwlK
LTFALGSTSVTNLNGVHADLVRVVRRAIEISPVDFQVFEGTRTRERQTRLVASGASQTMDSRHIPGADGFGHAVDLVPVVDLDGDGKGELRWDWPLCYKVAWAVRRASMELGVPVRWGGCWDKALADLDDDDVEHESAGYVARRKAVGKKAFLDGPHFELPAAVYP